MNLTFGLPALHCTLASAVHTALTSALATLSNSSSMYTSCCNSVLHDYLTLCIKSVYRPYDVFTEARRNGNQLHRVVENTGGICERELKTFTK